MSDSGTLISLVQRFADVEASWLSTVRPNGRSHSSPIWHIWYEGRVYVVTKETAVKTHNILHNPSVVITHPDPKDVVIIEGMARLAPEKRTALRPLLLQKYKWDISDPDEANYNTVIEITPTRLIAWGAYGNGRWTGAEVTAVRDLASSAE